MRKTPEREIDESLPQRVIAYALRQPIKPTLIAVEETERRYTLRHGMARIWIWKASTDVILSWHRAPVSCRAENPLARVTMPTELDIRRAAAAPPSGKLSITRISEANFVQRRGKGSRRNLPATRITAMADDDTKICQACQSRQSSSQRFLG